MTCHQGVMRDIWLGVSKCRVPDIGDLNSVTLTSAPGEMSQPCRMHDLCDVRAAGVIMPCTILMALTLKIQSMESDAGHYTGCNGPILV